MFTQFTELSSKDQKSINSRFILPTDLSKVIVTEKNVPLELFGKSKVQCTLRTSALIGGGFHNHTTRVNS